MLINTKYAFGDLVFLKTDSEQLERMVTSLKVFPGDILCYNLSCGTVNTDHYEMEVSSEKDALKELGISDNNVCK